MLEKIQSDSWYSPQEVANNKWLFGLAIDQIRKLIQGGEIEVHILDKKKKRPTYRIKGSTLLKYIRSFNK